MCGISGWIDWRRDLSAEASVFADMTRTMACRGPDAEGSWIKGHAALGHRRLAVIDIEGGAQPMSAARGTGEPPAVLTYSGEIYNFVELRRELEVLGHRFRSRSDTEVLLRAYLQWGERCVDRLNGMFAFALWDDAEQELLLARDRLGIKPLYYHPYDSGLLFGSEPKAILANPIFEPVLDEEGIAELFAMFGSRTPGTTVLRDLHEVRPGTVLRVRRNGTSTRRYWALTGRPHTDDPETSVQTVRALLADSVERQLVSDVPLCVLVSGGLDSSAIAALATGPRGAAESSRLSTFSVDFDERADDLVADEMRPSRDAPYVRRLVEHLRPDHTDVVLDLPDLMAAQDAATDARDLPCLGDLDGSLYLLFKAISGRSTVALSGESADEVFGGYWWFHDRAAVDRAAFPWMIGDSGFGQILAPALARRVKPREYVADRYAQALAEVPRLDGESGVERRMREVGHFALTRHLPMLLDRKDRMSMAVGLEVRVPFSDHRLVEYVWNIPWRLKTPEGVPKGLLRRAVADLLPPDLAERPKSVFPVPADPGYDAAVRQRARALVERESLVGPLLDGTRVVALAEGTSTRPPWAERMALGYLLQIERWLGTHRVRVTATV